MPFPIDQLLPSQKSTRGRTGFGQDSSAGRERGCQETLMPQLTIFKVGVFQHTHLFCSDSGEQYATMNNSTFVSLAIILQLHRGVGIVNRRRWNRDAASHRSSYQHQISEWSYSCLDCYASERILQYRIGLS